VQITRLRVTEKCDAPPDQFGIDPKPTEKSAASVAHPWLGGRMAADADLLWQQRTAREMRRAYAEALARLRLFQAGRASPARLAALHAECRMLRLALEYGAAPVARDPAAAPVRQLARTHT
jgi:hypothetical protein